MNSTVNSTSNIVAAYPAPAGVTPNFANPESIGHRVVICAIVCPVAALPFLLLRLYTQRFLVGNLHLDDYAIILAMVTALANSAVWIYQTKNGLGIHIWDLSLAAFIHFFKVGSTYGHISFNFGTLFVKASISLFYLRFPSSRRFRVSIYLVVGITLINALTQAFSFALLCRPIAKFWNFQIPGTCGNFTIDFEVGAALNVLMDLTLLLLPIWLLKPLKLERFQKLGITIFFMTGSFVCAVSIVRLVIILQANSQDYVDASWDLVVNVIWCLIELYGGIICACLPSIKTFTKLQFPSFVNSFEEMSLPSFISPSRVETRQTERTGNIYSFSIGDSSYEGGRSMASQQTTTQGSGSGICTASDESSHHGKR